MSVAPISALPSSEQLLGVQQLVPAGPAAPQSFGQMLQAGLEGINAKVTAAEQAVHAFALDDSIPVHQVSFALEQARLSLEMMLQVRGRLVEGYQQLMNMQL